MDPWFGFTPLLLMQLFWIAMGISWLFKRGDEVPLISAAFLIYVAGFRYYAVVSGRSEWVDLHNFGFNAIQDRDGLVALNYLVFGQSVFLLVYRLAQTKKVRLSTLMMEPKLAEWLRPKVFLFGSLGLVLVVLVRGRMSAQSAGGQNMVEMSGYLYLLPMMLISVGILLATLWKLGELKLKWHKAMAAFLICGLFYLTFGSTGRYQFIGWLIGGLVIASTGLGSLRRSAVLGAGATAVLALVAIGGAMRSDPGEGPLGSPSTMHRAALDRATSAEDANMLDGFVFIQKVYPAMLEYSKGMEHVEIFLRPIPRSWWPQKPVGGYMNKLGLTSIESGMSLGISPSLFGSFLQEGGLPGVLILSAIYGIGLGSIVRFSVGVAPAGGLLIRGIVAAAMIPLLRGGDLPGIYAWFGMAFWPCFLVLWLKRRELGVTSAPRVGTPRLARARA